MECHACGSALEPSDKFCPSCGAKVEAGGSASEPKASASEGLAEGAEAGSSAGGRRRRDGSVAPGAARRRDAQDEDGPAPRPRRRRDWEGSEPRRRAEDDDSPRASGKGRGMGMWVGAILVSAVMAVMVYWKYAEEEKSKHGGQRAPMAGPEVGGGAPMGGPMMGGGGPAMPDAPRVPSEMDIVGTVKIGDAVKGQVPTRGAIYLVARPVGQTAGPPLASVKLEPNPAGTAFVIGPADVMIDGDFNQPLNLQARWDQDGDAFTKEPTDLVGEAVGNPIKPGSKEVVIVFDRLFGGSVTGPSVVPSGGAESAPEAGAESAPAGDAPAAGGDITGTVTVAPALAGSLPSGGVLFLSARPGSAVSGPPMASVKLVPNGAGVPFSIGQKDVMMGGTFAAQPVTLQARWDQDGNAMTKQPGDLTGTLSAPVAPGTGGVSLVLDQKLP